MLLHCINIWYVSRQVKKGVQNQPGLFCLSDLLKKLITQKLLNLERYDTAHLKAYQIIYRMVPSQSHYTTNKNHKRANSKKVTLN